MMKRIEEAGGAATSQVESGQQGLIEAAVAESERQRPSSRAGHLEVHAILR